MKIADIETTTITIPLIRPHKTALATSTTKDYVIVKAHSDDGIIGIGETIPRVPAGETSESVKSTIDRYLKPVVMGADPFDIERITNSFDKVIKWNSFAKSAVNIALYDMIAKKLKVPLYKLLGGKYRDKVPLSWSLASADSESDVKEALKFVEKGFKIFKVKVGVLSPDKEVERVNAIRDAVGDGVDIRVDANQAWTPDIAIRIIRKMERNELGFVEQPVPWWDLDGMASIARAIDTPIMADESVCTLYDALTVIKKKAADLFSLKSTKLGGINNSKKVATVAEAGDIPCYVGTQVESGIGSAAGVHLACSTRNITYGCELFGPLLLQKDTVKKPPEIQSGFLKVPEEPGLGIELDEEIIKKLKVL